MTSTAATKADALTTAIIVMSSYNSANYIIEQIQSILNQVGVSVRLWVRDDGSTDGTVNMIMQHFSSDHRVAVSVGSNLGACQSFLEAARTCPFKGDFFGFSDADDVWNSDKLAHCVAKLESELGASDIPLAVSTRIEVVDESLDFICYSRIPTAGLGFASALTETVTTGMTILMNKRAFDLLIQHKPEFAAMHDSWAYLLITAMGKFVYSPHPTVKYRQHDRNVFGTAHTLRKRLALRWGRLNTVSVYRKQALEFMALYGNHLEKPKLDVLRQYCQYPDSLRRRLAFMINPSVVQQRWQSSLLLRLLALLGRA